MMRNRPFAILSFAIKPLLVCLIVLGVFSLVYLRSGFLRLEYGLSELEQKKMKYLKERKMLLAEKTSLLSFAKFEGDFNGKEGFVLPDRLKVVHLSKQKNYASYKASLEKKQLAEP
jgi:hypothetical protein